MNKIKIAQEFSDTPGARHSSDGEFSGQAFREKLLRPRFELLQPGDVLEIDFDGAYGYPPSFLEEAFGGLVREIGNSQEVLDKLKFISDEEPNLIDEVIKYIKNALS